MRALVVVGYWLVWLLTYVPGVGVQHSQIENGPVR